MMSWWLLLVAIPVLCFSFVLLRGAPYLPTLKPQIKTALDLLDLKEGQTMLELGCGDGRVLIAAAQRGWKVVGYELNPLLAAVCWLRTRRYKGQVKVVCGDFWQANWPEADGIFTFLLQKYTKQLNTKIVQNSTKPVKLVSFAFYIPDKQPTVEKDGLYLYEYR
jgi:SAM-dependent methyltransferase